MRARVCIDLNHGFPAQIGARDLVPRASPPLACVGERDKENNIQRDAGRHDEPLIGFDCRLLTQKRLYLSQRDMNKAHAADFYLTHAIIIDT